MPKGSIEVNVQNGVVQLRGEAPTPQMIKELIARTRTIASVRGVESLLHLPRTAASTGS